MRALFLFCAGLTTLLAATASPAPAVDGTCPVTTANGLVPPGAPPGHYGNGRLATFALGVITQAPEADGSIWVKYMWWGTREPRKPLRIVGRRLDPLNPLMALRVHEGFTARANESYYEGIPPGIRFWASGVTFPTQGCWRVTGIVGRVRLSVVVLVQAASQPGTISRSSSIVK